MARTGFLHGVTRTFKGKPAVTGLDLSLEPGRIYGLLGPNGSGKTTTIRLLLGLIEPDRGAVELFGAPPDDRSRARVGYVPEQRGLPETARPLAVLTLFARMRGRSRKDAIALGQQWLERLELAEKARERIKTLSNGQQQKVQIALAMMGAPDLLLLDEPLSALDPEHQDQVIQLVREAAARGATVVMSTHRLREAQEVVDHVVLMHRGTKVLDRPLRDALEDAFDGTWRIVARGDTGWVSGPEIAAVTPVGDGLHVRLADGAQIGALLARAATAGAEVLAIERVLPTLHQLYLTRVRRLDPQADLGDPG